MFTCLGVVRPMQLIWFSICLSPSIFVSFTSAGQFCGHSSDISSGQDAITTTLRRVPRAAQTSSFQHPQRHDSISVRFDITSERVSDNGKHLKTGESDCRKRRAGRFEAAGPQQGDCRPSSTSASLDNNKLEGKTIETAVFIDQALDNKFNGLSNGLVELNKLIQTIMNQVQYLFKYSSLKVPIRIKLVLVEHLRESERRGFSSPNSARGDIDAYLTNFCNWQQTRLESDRRLWWDHAILLSGLDLYKNTPGRNHSGVLGLAWVGGMCKGNYSCTINEASNFESSFVIAHELGHSLGIMHGGQKNRCDPNDFIMSERTGAGKVHWSRCSNQYLNDSIQRGHLACLDMETSGQRVDSLYDLDKLRQPGQVYSINEQCKMAFGSNFTSIVSQQQQPFNNVCRELWCVSGTWARAAHPALEGSICGDQQRLCREGKCIIPT